MSAAVSIDGVLVDPGSASVPIMDRGFLYGDSAFEVTRTYGGQPFALGPHLARLRASCVALGIALHVSDDALGGWVHAALEAAAIDAERYVRVIVTRGTTPIGLGVGRGETPRVVIVVLPLPEQPAGLYTDGVELATVTTARALDGTGAGGAKASNYLPNILSLAAARERGGYEALSVGPAGEILEGATSNVFLVHGGVVSTPPLAVGILGGITRRLVIEAAEEDGVTVVERLVFPPDLYGADEAFITSSLREVVPVVRADGVTLGDGRPGPVARRLHSAFRRRADALLSAERTG